MDYEKTFQEQVDRVRSQSWELTLSKEDPVTVEISNVDSNRTHTVVPYELSCSCPKQEEGEMLCDHFIALSDAEGFAGALTREYLKERTNTYTKESDTTADERDQISALLQALNLDDYSLARTQVEMVAMMNSMMGNNSADDVPKPEEDRSAYRSMVRRVRIEEKDEWLPECE